MTTTETERRNWTAVGANTAAQRTYASVRVALEPVIQQHDVDVFLQGSYANHTNVRADSDVDIVVMNRESFQGSIDRLGASAAASYSSLPLATYTAAALREDVTAALVKYYGASRVHPKNKCVRVDKRDGYVDADIVPCLEYRYYTGPESIREYIEGIAIHPLAGHRIVNYPKEHIKNGQAKNKWCHQRYKPTVRQIKRLRTRAERLELLPEGVAPGYLLECMTYNVPDSKFTNDNAKRLQDVVLWLKFADKSRFLSCDRIHHLFVDDPGSFSIGEAQDICDALWEAF